MDADGDVHMQEDGSQPTTEAPSQPPVVAEEDAAASTAGTPNAPEETIHDTNETTEEALQKATEGILHITIDTRRKEWVFSPIERNEVIFAIEKEHEEDVLKTVRRVGRFGSGLYQLTSPNYARYVGKNIELRGIQVPLVPFYQRPRRDDRKHGGGKFRFRGRGDGHDRGLHYFRRIRLPASEHLGRKIRRGVP